MLRQSWHVHRIQLYTVLLIFYADNHTIRVSCQIPYNMKQVHCSAPGPRKGSPRTFLPRITVVPDYRTRVWRCGSYELAHSWCHLGMASPL